MLNNFINFELLFTKLSGIHPQGAFNNYVDQILTNFDPLPPSSGQAWTFYILLSAWLQYLVALESVSKQPAQLIIQLTGYNQCSLDHISSFLMSIIKRMKYILLYPFFKSLRVVEIFCQLLLFFFSHFLNRIRSRFSVFLAPTERKWVGAILKVNTT